MSKRSLLFRITKSERNIKEFKSWAYSAKIEKDDCINILIKQQNKYFANPNSKTIKKLFKIRLQILQLDRKIELYNNRVNQEQKVLTKLQKQWDNAGIQ